MIRIAKKKQNNIKNQKSRSDIKNQRSKIGNQKYKIKIKSLKSKNKFEPLFLLKTSSCEAPKHEKGIPSCPKGWVNYPTP